MLRKRCANTNNTIVSRIEKAISFHMHFIVHSRAVHFNHRLAAARHAIHEILGEFGVMPSQISCNMRHTFNLYVALVLPYLLLYALPYILPSVLP